MAEDQENAPKKESAEVFKSAKSYIFFPMKKFEFVVEVGTICFGKVAEKWFEGQIMHVNAKKNTVLFRRITRSASGRVELSLAEDTSVWIPCTDLHRLDTEPSDGAEIRRAEVPVSHDFLTDPSPLNFDILK